MVHAACWYVALVFAITHLSNIVVSVRSFFLFFFFNVVKVEQSMIPACPSLMCSFNRGSSEGTYSSKKLFVYVFYFLFV